jgi:hypothetical protein
LVKEPRTWTLFEPFIRLKYKGEEFYHKMSTFWWMEFGKTLNEFRRKWLGLRPLNEDQALKSKRAEDLDVV